VALDYARVVALSLPMLDSAPTVVLTPAGSPRWTPPVTPSVTLALLVFDRTSSAGLAITRISPRRRERLTVPLAVATGIPLVATVTGPPLPVTVVLWAASGMLATYMDLAQVSFTQLVPAAARSGSPRLACRPPRVSASCSQAGSPK
jgi:hypothetical protein